MKKLEEALEKASTALTSKSLNGNAIDAMHFSQAALNCVQALGSRRTSACVIRTVKSALIALVPALSARAPSKINPATASRWQPAAGLFTQWKNHLPKTTS